ncbi:recombinase family protein [Clostridium bowmanii]|uniref:recombinase family protein n=1 Tax=Clostridium bowmanii TaxID=132925 RepID=UPI001C0D991C|nr:recombinase family protein [Clostridium bowmanii]MBU3188930.1 recombinase family protein [Clostridium bowmanii]MCA1073661.1 recombinase family protein [Clostridium bowmanii]
MRSFFYARVSSKDQSLERQVATAKELGIQDEYIFIEKASGKDFKRPEYQLMKRILRSGDILYIKSLDRLGRNKQMLLDEWKELIKNKEIDIIVLDMPLLNTTKYKDMKGIESLIVDLILQLLSYMAEDERTRIKERQKEGISIAMKKGIKFGRKKIPIDENFKDVYRKWKQGNITAVKAMELVDMKNNTFYRRVKEYESL